METPLAALQQQLDRYAPRTVLYLTRGTPLALAGGGAVTVRADVAGAADLAGEGRYDLALVADLLEHLPRADGIALLGRLRNLHAARVLAFHAPGGEDPWTLDDFIALGFRREAQFSDGARALALYGYDLATYNHEREWNNPRFWANPQNWGKYFW